MKNIIFIIGLFLFTSQGFADEIFDIEFTEPIKINETKTAQAKITGLTAEAKEAGFAVMLLAGDVRYESTGDNQVRVYITWKNLTDGKNLTQPLTSEFTSQFRTDDPVVKTGQSITAAGSQADLGNSMYAFKERLDVDTGAPEAAVNKPAEASADEFGGTPDYFSGAAGGGGSFGGSSDPNAELDEIEPVDPQNNQVTTEACELRIDYGKRAGFLQVKEITTNLITGQKTDGVCSDTGETVPFVRELSKDCGLSFDHTKRAASKQYVEFVSYDGQRIEVTGCTPDKTASIPYERVYDDKTCSVVPDFSGGKIYVQYKEYVLDDFTGNQTVKVEVTGCTNDHSKSYELKSTNEGCGFRSDFVQGKTYLQRKYRYTNSAGEVIDASSCQDSSTSYTVL